MYQRILHQLIAHFFAGAQHHVQDSRGQSSFHHRIPIHQRWRDFPDRNRNGEIPRRDGPDYAQRLPDRIRKCFRGFAGQCFAVNPARFTGHEFRDVDRPLYFAQRVLQRLSFFAGQQPRQLFFLLLHNPHNLEENFAAIRRGRVAPGREGRLGRRDGAFHLFARRKRNARDHLIIIRRVAALKDLGRFRFDPFAIDEVLAKLIGSGSGHHVDPQCLD